MVAPCLLPHYAVDCLTVPPPSELICQPQDKRAPFHLTARPPVAASRQVLLTPAVIRSSEPRWLPRRVYQMTIETTPPGEVDVWAGTYAFVFDLRPLHYSLQLVCA